MIEKIIIEGPESSGKTTLAANLRAKLQIPLAPEMAREFLAANGPQYSAQDIYHIAALYEAEVSQTVLSHPMIICDTGYLNLLIWLQDKFDIIDAGLTQKWQEQSKGAITLLCRPDIPWEPDPLREDRYRRNYLFEQYYKKCSASHLQFIVIEGDRKQEIDQVLTQLEKNA